MRLCAFCARPALEPSDACLPCLRELGGAEKLLASPEFREAAAARAGAPSSWLGKVAESDAFAAEVARPLVDGSLDSLRGLAPGAKVLLELDGRRLTGRNLWAPDEVDPAPAVVGGRPGALYVDTSDRSGWSASQVAAWRELDALEESLDEIERVYPAPGWLRGGE